MTRALYVITRAQRRGAEVDATLLAAELAGEHEPLVVTLFAGEDPAILGGRVPIMASRATPGRARRALGVAPGAVRHVRRAILDFAPDLVVAYGGEPLLHATAAVAASGRRRAGTPVLYVKISMSPAKLRRPGVRRALFRRAARRAGALAAVAPHLVRELREDLGVNRPVHLTPTFRTAADIPPARQRAAVRAELGAAEDDLLVAFAGSLSPEKAPDVALEAVALAPPGVRLLMAGDGPMAAGLAERAARPDLAGRVHLLGARTDVPRLLSGADAVLVTSSEEGRPGVILEAALGGLPVVATWVGGIPDLVVDGVEGILVPPGDAQGLARALGSLAGDPALRAAMGEAAGRRGPGYLAGAVLPAWREAFAAALGHGSGARRRRGRA